MPQSLAQVWLHVVFSTKQRKTFLQDEAVREEMFRMLSHHVQEIGCIPQRAGGWIDHVHIVCGLARTVTIANLLEHVKTETSKWFKSNPRGDKSFQWQSGYGVFSVSQSNLQSVIEYVDGQAERHKRQSFQGEFRELCQRYEIKFDERYMWD